MSLNKISQYSYIISGGSINLASGTLGNLTATQAGNIGINNPSPNYTLDVNGTINATTYTGGNISISGSITAGNSVHTNSAITNSTISTLLNTNFTSTNVSSNSLKLTTGITTGNIYSVNLNLTNISSSTLTASNITLGSLYLSNVLNSVSNTNTFGNLFTTSGNIGINNTMPIAAAGLDIKSGSIRLSNNGSGILWNPTSNTTGNAFSSIYDDANLHLWTDDNLYIQNNNGNALYVNSSINIGIGTTSPIGRFNIYESTSSNVSATYGTLFISRGNTGGSSSIVFPSVVSNTDYGYIQYIDSVTATGYTSSNYFGATGVETGALIIGCESHSDSTSGPDSVIITPAGNVAITPRNNLTYISGNVGIATTAPTNALTINGTFSQGGYASMTISTTSYAASTGSDIVWSTPLFSSRVTLNTNGSYITIQDPGMYMFHVKVGSNSTTSNTNLQLFTYSYNGSSWVQGAGSEWNTSWTNQLELNHHSMVSASAGQQFKIVLWNASASAFNLLGDATGNSSRLMIHKIG